MLQVPAELVGLSAEPVLLVRNGRILYANTAACQLFGADCTGAPAGGVLGAGLAGLQSCPCIQEAELGGQRYLVRVQSAEGLRLYLFRAAESAALRSAVTEHGIVLACGGGVVTRVDNYGLLHQNGTIVFLDRPIEELSSHGRPLSERFTVEGLARLRMHWYRTWADLRIETTGSARGDAEAIRAALGI